MEGQYQSCLVLLIIPFQLCYPLSPELYDHLLTREVDLWLWNMIGMTGTLRQEGGNLVTHRMIGLKVG